MGFLAERRQELGLTQAQIAEALGIDQAAVSRWESGMYLPKGRNLIALAKLLNCSPEKLLPAEPASIGARQ